MQRFKYLLLIIVATLLVASGLLRAQPPEHELPATQASLFEAFLLEARNDLEALANEVIGIGERPETWKGNEDLSSEVFVPDLWFDNEQLADSVFDVGQRPANWFSLPADPANTTLISRNVRHDLELMADAIFGEQVRPDAWNGAAQIYRCSRTTQNTVRLLDTIYNSRPTTSQSAFDFCGALRTEIETDLISAVFSNTQEDAELPVLALALRGDLERLADETLGLNSRPPLWIGNREQDSPTLIPDVAADIERLADTLQGDNIRPEDWAGFISGAPALSYRNLRFNLESLADLSLSEGVRPNGWQGEDPVQQCDPLTQGLFFIVGQNYGYTAPDTILTSTNICQLLAEDTNNVAENPPSPEVLEEEGIIAQDIQFLAESEYAFSYLDVEALQYMGVMPAGIEFRAWYRNFAESNMMFVSGSDFAVFIDRRWTTLPEEVFNTLPTLDGVRPLTFCDANWCNGPGPTPTPTGGSAVQLLANSQTPQPTLDTTNLGNDSGRTQVSWNHVRVNYLLDRPDNGTVQVTLELCNSPAQLACEPVLGVFDAGIGADKPVISQFNGLNVYEFSYGYLQDLVITSDNLVSPDVWISDPTIR